MRSIKVDKLIELLARWWPYLLAFLGCAALILLFPFKITVVPEWRVRVLDDTGKPFAKVKVVQIWNHHSLDVVGHDEQWTDDNGYVLFPERTTRAGLLYRGWRSGRAAWKTPGPGGTEIRATVWAATPKTVSDFLEYKPDEPLPTQIILRR